MRQALIKFGLFFSMVIITGIGNMTSAQIYKAGAGLSFASGVDFNQSENGNPGLKLKTWISLDKRNNFHIVPTLTAFNPDVRDAGYYTLSNYMFMGDVDCQYMLFEEGTLKMVVFAGVNFTYLSSKVEESDPKYPLDVYAPNAPGDLSDNGLGGNVGAGLELRMGAHWDMNINAKYIVSKYSQFIMSVEGVFYFQSRRRHRR